MQPFQDEPEQQEFKSIELEDRVLFLASREASFDRYNIEDLFFMTYLCGSSCVSH